mmetsp:Transcript_52631/g.140282  ORF Transcript_52631/g.140282 Transcript_52631/m.140282 type:complete len:116 (-) Transcript_52631:4007-4354(-)
MKKKSTASHSHNMLSSASCSLRRRLSETLLRDRLVVQVYGDPAAPRGSVECVPSWPLQSHPRLRFSGAIFMMMCKLSVALYRVPTRMMRRRHRFKSRETHQDQHPPSTIKRTFHS